MIHATFKGHVYAWDGAGQLLWTADVGPDRPLSTPAIGDLDRDGSLEVVVAQGNAATGSAANALYVIDARNGAIERSWHDSLAIPGSLTSPGNYVHPPSLADLDFVEEPIMKVTVECPEHFQGAVTGHAISKRGLVVSSETGSDGIARMTFEMPLAELFSYSGELRNMTQGQGSFEMEFAHYGKTPSNVQKEIIEAKKASQLVGAS